MWYVLIKPCLVWINEILSLTASKSHDPRIPDLGGDGPEEDGQEGEYQVASTIAINFWIHQCKFFESLQLCGEGIALIMKNFPRPIGHTDTCATACGR